MPLVLHYHPLASFCHKVLIALYENEIPFVPRLVDLADPAQRAEFLGLWPIGKFPLLRDEARDRTIPESSIIIEYLQQHHPCKVRLIPEAADDARETRLLDRFFDLYVHEPMQKIVTDRLRPAGSEDPYGVEHARTVMDTAFDMLEKDMAHRTWAAGESFGLADCAAAPALFYCNKLMPIVDRHPHLARYLDRLMQRPSYARVLAEAQPYFAMFPG
jgi:glutathione S-transferase